MISLIIIQVVLLLIIKTTNIVCAFSAAGKGFGDGANAYISPFDRFKGSCPADLNDIQIFDPSLLKDTNDDGSDDIWVAVYRSSNNLPNVYIRDEFFSSMKASTTGDASTLTTINSSSSSSGVISGSNQKPVAVARLFKDTTTNYYILDSMRCVLKKETQNEECDGGSEHAEAIGVCVDFLVLSYLQLYLENLQDDKSSSSDNRSSIMCFDGGIHFRGTLVSGKLLDSRGFREVSELTADMHSHESDYDGSLAKYAERSTCREVAKNPGARDRALKIVSLLGVIDRHEDKLRAKEMKGGSSGGVNEGDGDEEEEEENDPWASMKRYL